MVRLKLSLVALVVIAFTSVEATRAAADITLAPPYNTQYSIVDLGPVPGVPPRLGGLTLKAGDLNTLLIGGAANVSGGVIDAIGVTRDASGHITSFVGTATQLSTAPNIDGGLAYGPGGVLFFTEWPNNSIGQIKPGSTMPDKTTSLTELGVASSVGSLNFVPADQPGAGQFKIASFGGGGFYTSSLTPDGTGTSNIGSATLESTPGGGPEGFVYVPPGSPLFAVPSLLLSEYDNGRVSAYQVDANGNPILASRADFITGLTGAEGAFIDPLTGDFLFSTFGGGDRVIEVRGFASAVPEPSTLVLGVTGALLGFGYAWRRQRGGVTA